MNRPVFVRACGPSSNHQSRVVSFSRVGRAPRNLDRGCPPDDCIVAVVLGDSPRRNPLTHTERNQCARVPKSGKPRYWPSRSSRHTCSMMSSGTFPGGSGHGTDAGRLFSGGVRTPRATNRCSCSEWSCRWQGMIRATGLLRSHTNTSSPSLTS